jgi:uncharacterized protein (UPF0332 family)
MSTVGSYMLLAEDCLAQAKLLYDNEFYRGACGKAYYAYFDAVRALLMSKEITTQSHSSVRGLFSLHFIKDGPFTKQDSSVINELFLLRQTGDYEPDDDISEADALSAVATATEFLLQTEAYLRQNGFDL